MLKVFRWRLQCVSYGIGELCTTVQLFFLSGSLPNQPISECDRWDLLGKATQSRFWRENGPKTIQRLRMSWDTPQSRPKPLSKRYEINQSTTQKLHWCTSIAHTCWVTAMLLQPTAKINGRSSSVWPVISDAHRISHCSSSVSWMCQSFQNVCMNGCMSRLYDFPCFLLHLLMTFSMMSSTCWCLNFCLCFQALMPLSLLVILDLGLTHCSNYVVCPSPKRVFLFCVCFFILTYMFSSWSSSRFAFLFLHVVFESPCVGRLMSYHLCLSHYREALTDAGIVV